MNALTHPAATRRSRTPPAKAGGFTLIELMITVAIVAVLLAVALPSYRSHVLKSNRAEAQSFLMAVAARQQQFMIDTRAYAALADVGVPQPDSVSKNYTVTLATEAGPPPTFVLKATPKTEQASEACGTISINQAGTKTAAKTGCW